MMAIVSHGGLSALTTVTGLKAARTTGSVITPSKNFTFHWRSATLTFRQGEPQIVTSDLLAALQGSSTAAADFAVN